MHAFTVFTSLSLLAGALALPAPEVEKRSCQSFYQPELNQLFQNQPDTGVQSTTTPFYVYNQNGRTDLLASFRYLPANIYGCTLQFDYEPGNNPIVTVDSGEPTLINVYNVADGGNFPYTPTWDNTNSRTGSLVGTFQFPSGSALNEPQVITINSFVCNQIMDFRFSVADDDAIGGVQVDENSLSGLRIQYDC
jgi:hypothetical protein